MTEPLIERTDWDDVEALVRAAGGYVRPSDDLRPSVLEAARAESHERWARRQIWQLALVVALLGLFSTAAGRRLELAAPFAEITLESRPATPHADGEGSSWNSSGWNGAAWTTVECFTDLRRRQAELLRLTR